MKYRYKLLSMMFWVALGIVGIRAAALKQNWNAEIVIAAAMILAIVVGTLHALLLPPDA